MNKIREIKEALKEFDKERLHAHGIPTWMTVIAEGMREHIAELDRIESEKPRDDARDMSSDKLARCTREIINIVDRVDNIGQPCEATVHCQVEGFISSGTGSMRCRRMNRKSVESAAGV